MLPKWLLSIKGRTCNPNTTCTPRHDKENNRFMYAPSLISIPLILSKIWPESATIMKKNGEWEITQ